MRGLALACVLGLFGAFEAIADSAIPERRLIVTRDVDFYGGDLQPLFDTTLQACQRQCLNNPACQAFTFNTQSRACFPKTGVSQREPYVGATSAIVVAASPEDLGRADRLGADLDFLDDGALLRARDEAAALGIRHGGGEWTVPDLLRSAQRAQANDNLQGAVFWTGAAVAQSDDAAHWLQYAEWSADYATALRGSERVKFRNRAYLAAINAYLRSETGPQQVAALLQLAQALEALGRGRDMIAPLRLAETLGPRADVVAALDSAIGKYGFRIVETQVEADTAEPRICAVFSEDLERAGADYTLYVRLPDPKLAISNDARRVCVSGVQHGERYRITFRSGLPAQGGEALHRDVTVTQYVRDRSPALRFPGRAYVLPRSADAGIPLESVNTPEAALTLRQVSDRNLLRMLEDRLFGRPLSAWDMDRFGTSIAHEVWRGTATLRSDLNQDQLTRLPLGAVIADRPAGIYALTAEIPGSDPYDSAAATQWFVLTDIGLTTLQGQGGLTVHARSLGDAGALEGVSLTLISRANGELGRAETGADGVARFPAGLMRGRGGAEPALVVARRGEGDLAFLSLQDPAFDLSDRGVAGREPSGPIDAFLATDRGAYRAGEVINATVLLRDTRAAALEGVPVTAILTRPDGVEYSRHLSTRETAGGHVFALPLADAAPRGTWRLAVHADPDAAALATQSLLVEDFVPERLDLALSLPEGALSALAPPALSVQADYLFGAPGADLRVEGEVQLRATQRLPERPGWVFGPHDAGTALRLAPLPAEVFTDATGAAQVPLRLPDLDARGRLMEAQVTVRVAEGSGRPVERAITRPVLSPTPVIGIRPAFDGALPEASAARFALQAFDPGLNPADMTVAWRIDRVQTRYQWYQLDGRWNWEPVTTRITLQRGEAQLGADVVEVSADVDWGRHEIVVERLGGSYLVASYGFDAGWYAPAEALDTPDLLEMSLDKPRYAPGDTATVRMVAREAGEALITVLADRVIAMQAVPVVAGENTLALPVTDDWGAGVYVAAQVVRPMQADQGRNPARSLGLAHAGVDPGDRHLTVAFDAPQEVEPRQSFVADVTLGALAADETAYVTVAAVDVGILNLTAFETPDPADHYFGQRRLGVDIRDLYGRLLDGLNGEMGQIRSGGDAGPGLRMQSPPPTEALVAQFSGPVRVGPDGRARVRIDIPDFNGTVRLMALAWSAQGVGSAEADVLVRDPVVMATSLPRFLAPGDETRLGLELTHTRGAAGEMALSVQSEGLTLGAVPQTVTLAEGGRARVRVPLTAEETGDHRISVRLVTPDGKELTRTLTLGVRSNDPQQGTTRRLALAAGQTFTLDGQVLAGFRPDGAEVLVSAGPLARFDAPGLLAALDRYPYGCTEQITSQVLPLLTLSSIAAPLGLGPVTRIEARVAEGIAQVLTRQSANGAFGLWSAGSGEGWLDAYVTDFLLRAREAGHAVPDKALQSALDNLSNRIAYAPDFDQGGEAIAYALHVLARAGRAAMGDLRYYADEKADAFATPMALAQLGAALASYGDQARADRLFRKAAERLARAEADPGQVWRADFGTSLRDAAGLLSLAVESGSEAIDRAALSARFARPGRLSTQEQAWALLAAQALVRDPSVSGLQVDGAPVAGPFVRRISGQDLSEMRVTNAASRPTDLTITTLGVPSGPTEAQGYGYRLERAYFTPDGDPVDPARLAQGDRLVVVLTVRPSEDTRARLMIDDPLPAGLEIDAPTLIRSGDIRGLGWLQTDSPETAEFRSDRFLAAIDQRGAETLRVAYMVRAVSPGRFHHPAALVEDMYRPDYRATTASGEVVVAAE